MRRFALALGLLLLVGCGGKRSVAERVATYGPIVKTRLAPAFAATSAVYPPAEFTLIALKAEKRLELWAPDARGQVRLVKSYPIQAASGRVGPKLRAGDNQVPEGFYAVESLNPNSRFHLALRVGYPNAEDRQHGREDGREELGGDIMIHGGSSSVGCLAMGDPAAEELFVLAAQAGFRNVRIIISPVDFRKTEQVDLPPGQPAWVPALHARIRAELSRYR
jgi:murein L,D-transpeptidase YafK